VGELDDRAREPAWRRYLRFWGSDPARDLDDELRFHLSARYDEFITQGLSPAEARDETRRRFGDVARVRDECETIDSQWTRERSMTDRVQRVSADLRYAIRQLRRNASLGVTAILCLALGIGANTGIFSVVNAVLYRPLPFHDAERLVIIGEGLPRFSDKNFGQISRPEYADFQRLDGRIFSGMAAYETGEYAVSSASATPERARAVLATVSFFDVVGAPASRGRGFIAADGDTASPAVVVISDALWHRRFSADARILGSRIDVDGRPSTVVGIMPPGFQFPLPGAGGQPADLFVPLRMSAADISMRANSYNTWLIARLAPGVSRDAAAHAVDALARSLPKLHPESYPPDWLTVADAFPLRGYAVKDVRRPLLVLLAGVALVLVIACINVSSLVLARAAAREREIAVRQALGASFGRLVQQFLAESFVLVAVGGGLGVLIAVFIARFLAAHAPSDVLHGYAVAVDLRVLGLTAFVALLTTIAFSLLPAVSVGRGAFAARLHETGRATAGAARQRARRGLVVTQIALALLLTTAAGLMIRSFLEAKAVDPGFDPEHAVAFHVGLPHAIYSRRDDILRFERRTIDALHAIPGVRAVAATNQLPPGIESRIAFSIEGRDEPRVPLAINEIVSAEYFTAMGIRIEAGRAFIASDADTLRHVAIINETLAHRYFGDRTAIGKRIKWGMAGSSDPWQTIVGVASDVRQVGIDQPVDPAIYFPVEQQSEHAVLSLVQSPAFVVRTDGDPRGVLAAVPRVLRAVDPSVPLVGLQRMTDVVDTSLASRTFNTALLAAFALLALALASIGIYGVIVYSVVQRTREIGVRIAIGAMPREILRLVVGQGVRLAGVGVIIGLAGALALTRAMRSLLFGVSPFDAPSFVAAAVVLFVVAIVAGYLPARRAAHIDPQVALRSD
jgi:predicted permease